MGTGADLRIIQRITKTVQDAGDTLVIKAKDGLELLIWLRHAGALGEADVKRQRSLKRKPDYAGLTQIDNALKWGQDVGKLSVVRSADDGEYMITLLPLKPIVDTDDELPAAKCIDPSMFKPMSGSDPAMYKHMRHTQWKLMSNAE